MLTNLIYRCAVEDVASTYINGKINYILTIIVFIIIYRQYDSPTLLLNCRKLLMAYGIKRQILICFTFL